LLLNKLYHMIFLNGEISHKFKPKKKNFLLKIYGDWSYQNCHHLMFCLKYETTCLLKGWELLLVYFTHKGHRMFAFERIISQVTIVSLQAFPCSQVFCTTPLPSWPSCFAFFQQGVVMITHYVAHMTNCQCNFFQNYLGV